MYVICYFDNIAILYFCTNQILIFFFQIEMEQLMEMLQAQMAAQRLSDSLDLSDAAAEMLGQYFRSLLQYFFTSGCAPNK